MQYELQGREGIRALEMNRTPALRAGMAPIATSARVAAAIAGLPPVPPDAADVMTGAAVAKQKAAAPLTPVQELVAEEVPITKAKAKEVLIVDPKAKAKAVLKPPPPKAVLKPSPSKSTSVSSTDPLPTIFGGKG